MNRLVQLIVLLLLLLAGTVNGEDITLEAEHGVISPPFVVTNGSIYQELETDTAAGGRAVYSFSVTNAGEYFVAALVNARSQTDNALLINIDAEPEAPYMLWRVPATSNFQYRTANWLGKGSIQKPEFAPKFFKLTAGPHQLILSGRGPGILLDRIIVGRRPGAPQNPQVKPN